MITDETNKATAFCRQIWRHVHQNGMLYSIPTAKMQLQTHRLTLIPFCYTRIIVYRKTYFALGTSVSPVWYTDSPHFYIDDAIQCGLAL